jgi:hypothetical protein
MRFPIILCALLITATCTSQTIDTEYTKQVDNFFSLYVDGKPVEAVDRLYSNNPWMATKTDVVTNVKTSIAGLSAVVGKYISRNVLVTETLGPRYVRIEYVVNCERQPLRFFFEFYKPSDVWMTFNFGYNSDLGEWISERAKAKVVYERE